MIVFGKSRKRIVLTVIAVAGAVTAAAQVPVDGSLPEYQAAKGVTGSIKSAGSDTMNNLMALWAEGFKKFYPNVAVEIEGKGSSTAPPALIAGTANFGPMSREMKAAEIDGFKKKFGYPPTPLPTSLDVLAVYVHKDNPLKGLSLKQLDAIFSKTRRGGLERSAHLGRPGIDREWARRRSALRPQFSFGNLWIFRNTRCSAGLQGFIAGQFVRDPGWPATRTPWIKRIVTRPRMRPCRYPRTAALFRGGRGERSMRLSWRVC